MSDRPPGSRSGVFGPLAVGAAAAAGVLPLWVMVSGSLRAPGRPPARTVQLVPDEPTLEAYRQAGALVDLWGQFEDSVIVAGVVTPAAVLVAAAAGFALSQSQGWWRRLGVGLSFVALMVPATSLIVSRFAFYRWLGVTDTLAPLVAPAAVGVSPFFVLLYAWSFDRVPSELLDAARLEGARPAVVWWRVAMPLVRPVTASVGVLAFVATWGNLLDPLVYLTDPEHATLPLGLRQLTVLERTDTSVLLAAATVATVPVLVGFVAVHRRMLGRAAEQGPR